MSSTITMALATGISLDHVRSLITKLNSDWDLVDERVVTPGRPPEPKLPDLSAIAAEARRLAAMAIHCAAPDDLFLDKLHRLSGWADDLESVDGDDIAQLSVLKAAADLQWSHA